ncbi:Transcriptional Coactivator p15 (PC4) domain containing protein [Naviculisporaceae sp. PSN 640]
MPKRNYDAESDGEPAYTKKSKSKTGSISRAAKPAKESSAQGQGIDGEGNPYFELSAFRRVSLQPFNGKMLINIREYYNAADGELKPGKKGISLNLDQYKAFLSILPQLNNELRAKGVDIVDPDMSSAGPASVTAPKEKSDSKKSKRANIEETSEEEE